MAKHSETGKRGEDLAIEFLEGKGFDILARNWKRQHAEIDIVASDENFIVFVEVKTRSSTIWGEPIDAISDYKMKQIIKGASLYLDENDCGNLEPRFDVVSIIINSDGVEIEYLDDAFYPTLE